MREHSMSSIRIENVGIPPSSAAQNSINATRRAGGCVREGTSSPDWHVMHVESPFIENGTRRPPRANVDPEFCHRRPIE